MCQRPRIKTKIKKKIKIETQNQNNQIFSRWNVPATNNNHPGEMYQRPGLVGDAIPKAYPNEQAARYSNGGANPPDLSTFVKSHHNGADYVI